MRDVAASPSSNDTHQSARNTEWDEMEQFELWWLRHTLQNDEITGYDVQCAWMERAALAVPGEGSQVSNQLFGISEYVDLIAGAVLGEPVAWRWRFKALDKRWRFQSKEPAGDPSIFEIEPLYAAPVEPTGIPAEPELLLALRGVLAIAETGVTSLGAIRAARAAIANATAGIPPAEVSVDTKRLDWLISKGCVTIEDAVEANGREHIDVTDGEYVYGTGKTLREAIDAAISTDGAQP